MSQNHRDDDKADAQRHTPAYDNGFDPNTDKLHHLLAFSHSGVKSYTAQLTAISADVAGVDPSQAEKLRKLCQDVLKPVKDLTGGVLVVHEMMAVLFVTITEAYLKDVLIYAVGIDPTLMRDTNQTVSYTDALNTKSLEHLPLAFRTKWVRKFTDYGGPTRWIKDLQAMGARGYRAETASQMETLWGVRHLVVHSASVADGEFVRRHPELRPEFGKRFIINGEHLKQWGAAMYDFVDVTDRYFVNRCAKT